METPPVLTQVIHFESRRGFRWKASVSIKRQMKGLVAFFWFLQKRIGVWQGCPINWLLSSQSRTNKSWARPW